MAPDRDGLGWLEVATELAAIRLLGCELERELDHGERLRVRIVETEAYDQDDEASTPSPGSLPASSRRPAWYHEGRFCAASVRQRPILAACFACTGNHSKWSADCEVLGHAQAALLSRWS